MDASTGNTLETAVVNIWRRVLGRTRIGLDDNFFEVGGTSLRAVQVVAAIKKDLKRAVSIVNLFECPTVRLLVAKLDESTTETPVSAAESTAASRGQQRRYNTMKRKTS
jgi:acyl carrier protein